MRDAGARRESTPGNDNAGARPALRIAFRFAGAFELDPRLRGDDVPAKASAYADAPSRHFTLTSVTSNTTATFGGKPVRGSAP
ncbi:hypothetical protein GCM10025793_15700 [Lysobacter lycopersici]